MKLFKKSLILLLLFVFTNCLFGADKLLPMPKYKEYPLNSIEDIEKYKTTEGLYVFSDINIDLNSLSIPEKKRVFTEILLPGINVVNKEIDTIRENVKYLSKKQDLTQEEREYANNLFTKYRVENNDWNQLLYKLIHYPTSLILTQGAIESGWGTSRFFKEGNNLFGMWSNDPNEPRIPSLTTRRNGFTPHLKKYVSVKDSIGDLVLTLSRHNAYTDLRKYINQNQSPEVIAKGLYRYSEEKDVYVKKVISTMKFNKFEKYDNIK